MCYTIFWFVSSVFPSLEKAIVIVIAKLLVVLLLEHSNLRKSETRNKKSISISMQMNASDRANERNRTERKTICRAIYAIDSIFCAVSIELKNEFSPAIQRPHRNATGNAVLTFSVIFFSWWWLSSVKFIVHTHTFGGIWWLLHGIASSLLSSMFYENNRFICWKRGRAHFQGKFIRN